VLRGMHNIPTHVAYTDKESENAEAASCGGDQSSPLFGHFVVGVWERSFCPIGAVCHPILVIGQYCPREWCGHGANRLPFSLTFFLGSI
jgi:hypothetical protein